VVVDIQTHPSLDKDLLSHYDSIHSYEAKLEIAVSPVNPHGFQHEFWQLLYGRCWRINCGEHNANKNKSMAE
jgi:hypothetical protein